MSSVDDTFELNLITVILFFSLPSVVIQQRRSLTTAVSAFVEGSGEVVDPLELLSDEIIKLGCETEWVISIILFMYLWPIWSQLCIVSLYHDSSNLLELEINGCYTFKYLKDIIKHDSKYKVSGFRFQRILENSPRSLSQVLS